MSTSLPGRAAFALYCAAFFLYLLGPLAVMAVTAFNASAFPQALPFAGFTLHWFAAIGQDRELLQGIGTSVLIGALAVLVAVPLGLAGALLLQQLRTRARTLLYVALLSPVPTPGVIIGISTVIFWRGLTASLGARALYNGVLLTVLGQSSFIAAYCMLVFLARLQRFDASLAEAARDLGASRTQVFAHVLLPFLRPALLSAAVLAFLASFENYNTTTFSILADKTLTTVLAGRVHQGVTPTLSALAVVIVALTALGAVAYDGVRQRGSARRARETREGRAAERPIPARQAAAVSSAA